MMRSSVQAHRRLTALLAQLYTNLSMKRTPLYFSESLMLSAMSQICRLLP
jgi:hypothetical protein